MSSDQHPPYVVSYIFLRRSVGVMGIALPLVLWLGDLILSGTALRVSFSAYYYSGMRDVMTGFLFSIAIFLLAYRGIDWKDEVAAKTACAFAVGVALLPTAPPNPTPGQEWISFFHFMFAGGMFLTLAIFSHCLFTRLEPGKTLTDKKKKRNQFYRICGWVMVASIALIALKEALIKAEVVTDAAMNSWRPTFLFELLAVVAFGASWLIKGETLFRDD